jgi:serine/threonine-protein kinase
MIADGWSRKKELFEELLDLPTASQRLRLEAIADGDPALAGQLDRLLAASRAEHLDDDFAAAVEALLDSSHLAAGTLVGPYRLGDEIARGGMGAVYRAVHEDTQRDVAIKVLNRAWASPLDRDRLVREYRMVAALDDEPRIARLYDVGTLEDGTPWFAMELVRGGLPITQYCLSRNPTLRARLQLFREVCAAVMHAHSRAIIHRDLKPSNILVSEKGDVKLLDFGIAGVLADLNQGEDQSQVSARSLTPTFAAPEQLTNQPVGAFTDLYVLGLVLYELITRTRPFDLERRTVSEVLDIILNHPPPPPSSAREGAVRLSERADWGDLDAICLKLLAINPRARYASAEGLLADIDRYLRGEPVLARPASRLYRLRKLITRRRRVVAAGATAAIVVVALTAWYSVRLAGERRETLAQMARTQRLQQFMLGLFSGAEPEVGPERELTVRRLLERGVLTADVLTSDRDIQAELTHTLGTLYGELGDFARADELLGKSLDEKARFLPEDDPRRIEGNVALALLRAEQMKLDEAETLARSALDTMKRSYPETHPLMIRGGLALGKTLTAQGKYADAIAQLDGVARHFDRSGAGTADEAAVLTELANAHQYAGHLDEADRLNRQVLEIDRRVHGDRHPTVADDLINLADAETTRGRYGEAETMLREAVSILRGWYGSDHPETGSAVRILATALTMQGKLDEAGTLLEESRDIFTRVYPGPHRRIGLVLNDLGTLAFRQGRYDDAIAAFAEALAVYRQVYPDGKSQYISVGLANLGSAFLEKGDYVRAEQTMRQAVELSREVLSPTHTNTAIAEIKLGRALVKLQRYDDAIPWLEQGRESLSKQADPSVSWLQRSREDLVVAFDRTGRAAEAERMRAEIGSSQPAAR